MACESLTATAVARAMVFMAGLLAILDRGFIDVIDHTVHCMIVPSIRRQAAAVQLSAGTRTALQQLAGRSDRELGRRFQRKAGSVWHGTTGPRVLVRSLSVTVRPTRGLARSLAVKCRQLSSQSRACGHDSVLSLTED
jgi:hypothetical protein